MSTKVDRKSKKQKKNEKNNQEAEKVRNWNVET